MKEGRNKARYFIIEQFNYIMQPSDGEREDDKICLMKSMYLSSARGPYRALCCMRRIYRKRSPITVLSNISAEAQKSMEKDRRKCIPSLKKVANRFTYIPRTTSALSINVNSIAIWQLKTKRSIDSYLWWILKLWNGPERSKQIARVGKVLLGF